MALYIGTNYHPHDWSSDRWPVDIQLMKDAGFNMVRLGHLCWDSYEPDNGVYTFDWFDTVINLFA
ncbi:MAG: beta-galactosidase, partial [Treponema sp.]|nr:beta-galactosidase [Treponema sp.]